MRPIASAAVGHLVPTLQGSDGEERQQRPEQIVEVHHPGKRAAAVVLAAFTLREYIIQSIS